MGMKIEQFWFRYWRF